MIKCVASDMLALDFLRKCTSKVPKVAPQIKTVIPVTCVPLERWISFHCATIGNGAYEAPIERLTGRLVPEIPGSLRSKPPYRLNKTLQQSKRQNFDFCKDPNFCRVPKSAEACV